MNISMSSANSPSAMGLPRANQAQMTSDLRSDLKNARFATSTQVKSTISRATGIDVNSATKTVDTNSDSRLTLSELARAQSENWAKAAEKLDTGGDGKLTKADVTARLDKVNQDRDADGNGKVSKKENTAYAASAAEQLDKQYTGTRLKGFSREEVSSQLTSVSVVGGRSSVMSGGAAYEYSQADKNGDGRVATTEGEDYVADKSGLSNEVKQVKAREKTENAKKSEQENKTTQSGDTDDASTSRLKTQSKRGEATDTSYQQSDAAVARQLIMVQTYSSVYAGKQSGRLAVSA